MSEKEKAAFEYKIKNVFTLKCDYTHLTKPFNPKQGCANFNISPSVGFVSSHNEVFVIINVIGIIKETEKQFINCTVRFVYEILNLKEFIKKNKDNTDNTVVYFNDKSLENIFIPTIIGVSYSTMRGILISKGGGTILQTEVLPVVDPHIFHKPRK